MDTITQLGDGEHVARFVVALLNGQILEFQGDEGSAELQVRLRRAGPLAR